MIATVAGTQTIEKPAPTLDVDSQPNRGWKVILFNDDITPMEVVIFALQRAAGLSLEVAEMVMWEAHEEGSAVVRAGMERDDALILCAGLRKYSSIEGLCPGLHCEAEPDDD